ncbi:MULTISPECIES: D-alanyl-D-alanine carboxypeptidase/D-alanyl-D-alanine-endopeptidase [unclassified Novosphingobium]|uniref:D-alanyl-D-alanine carboxypeptidase/D-alanyl-D-alanine endopeptidase n=1 Tax=unclassified Novosphingobium TaxID=2644732 RepID=UPI000EE3335C|nr:MULTISPECIES: D-alanyl-D-alanine carboxypeptidase/D-alanyl-D-alanine-endopeptidase [unclassified Novosphingobium]HCF25355.1 D-alanyl-D-alanine carboxypeptidase/D-alanyl-D-alanine-endopeptidase [Novosphingobium sp.]HQV03618.1 D-alanyl-D-alanine carboxypeptidase/D-alanyl-D-alanine-endopeptidase [Novosphingobium sp.]
MFRPLIPLALFALSAPALADAPAAVQAVPAKTMQQQVESTLAAAPQGTRFGLLVVDEAGKVVVSVNPDQRFIPASNTKMFTTAAAYALLPGMDQPDSVGGTEVALVPGKGGPNVVLRGRGDARMSSAADCKANCLAELADAVAAKTRKVHDVVGDDTFWPDQRWVPGMSWNNIGTDSGTATSSLNLDDNELRIVVTPGAAGQPPVVTIPAYFTLRNEAATGPVGRKTELFLDRAVNGSELRLFGTIGLGAKPWTERIGIDDPAHYAAFVFKGMLERRGVKVTGKVRAVHRPLQLRDMVRPQEGMAPLTMPGMAPLARLIPPPLAEDVVVINQVSQNLHAQVLFRRLGDREGTGSEQWAGKAMNGLFEKAGIPRAGYDFSDGSGMSTYNRVSPRAMIALLRWIDGQPWGSVWHASLPVAGRDGTLKRRFIGTPLEGNLTAKTGTLNATNALSGTFRTARGRRFSFAFFANDVPDGASALPAMEAVLLAVAAGN